MLAGGIYQLSMSEFNVYANPDAVAVAAADYLYSQITNCVAIKGLCHVGLPGGSTPARCLELLADKHLPWQEIRWYTGDERCYPIGHAERNDTMIINKLFSQHGQAIDNFYAIPAELGPEEGAKHYAQLIDATEGLDIVLLGMGEDGHTASLFPGNDALDDLRSVVPVYDAPKPPSERISIGLTTLQSAGVRIIIATGRNKREAISQVRNGVPLPVSQVGPDIWFLDEMAADNIDVTVVR